MNSDIYRQHIMELYKEPKNFEEMKNPTHEYEETSPTCGDEIKIQLKIKKGKVEDAKFYGSGCVISVVSSSLLTEKLKGMDMKDIEKMNKDDVLDMIGIKLNPARLGCALIPLKAAQKAIKK